MKKMTIAAIVAAAATAICGAIIAKKTKKQPSNCPHQNTSSNSGSKHCTKCGKELKLLKGKYTCARCGNIFCYDCVQKVTSSEGILDMLECTDGFVRPNYSIIKGGYFLCPTCAARFNNEVTRMNNAISSNKTVELVSINYQGQKKYSGSPLYINTPYYDDKRDATESLKALARYYNCNMVIKVEYDKDTKEEETESDGTYIHSIWRGRGQAVSKSI